jgi:hypothetical protein
MITKASVIKEINDEIRTRNGSVEPLDVAIGIIIKFLIRFNQKLKKLFPMLLKNTNQKFMIS